MEEQKDQKKNDPKASQGKLLMMGKHETVKNWRGELYVAIIQYGSKDEARYEVVPDSNHPADVEFLPPVKTFDDKSEALKYFFEMDRSKDKWRG